jgi:hypothetical protein
LLLLLSSFAASPAHAVMEDFPSVKLQGLDKSVGRTVTFETTVGSTIQYGPLFIKIHACREAPPIEKPESAAFLQIWEVPPGQEKSEWVFSGWMFASSPALSAMDHPVYDVWVLDCTGREDPGEIVPPEEETGEAAEAAEGTTDAAQYAESTPDDVEQAPPVPEAVDSEADMGEEPISDPAIPAASAESAPLSSVSDPAAHGYPEDQDGLTAYDFMRQPPAVQP